MTTANTARSETPAPAGRAEPVPIATALRAALRRGYRWSDLRSDLLAGIVVGVVALPLSMALAIASGVPPQHGIYTAIVAGTLTALLGGSAVQVSGPTAAFVVILAPISAKYGVAGLAIASAMAGFILILMGVARLGKLIEFVPYPVTTGFTAGIAIVIATGQLKDFFGLAIPALPDHYVEKLVVLGQKFHSLHWSDLAIGVFTLAVLLFAPRLTKRVPSPLIGLSLAALLAAALAQLIPGFTVETIQSRFHGISQQPPWPMSPLSLPGPGGAPFEPSYDTLRALLGSAFAIAMLGAIESLLSAVVADGMAGTKHDPDSELIGQGVGNVIAPFFGGFAATGAIARTATGVRSGARSPLAAVFHAHFILLTVLALAPLLGYLPMASLAALLLIVAWRMSEIRHVVHVLRVAPRSDKLVLLTCLSLTVIFDMVVAVTAGVLLAALLFMKRMAEVTGAKLVEARHETLKEPMPAGVLLYEVAGPLFFGAAQRAMSALHTVEGAVTTVVLDLRAVPVMDATGLVNLESALDKLHEDEIYTILAGVQRQPLELMARAGWKHRDWLAIYGDFSHGISVARDLALLVGPKAERAKEE